MAERMVGLDVGTRAVRVAEVEPGPRPVLRAFGQVDLPAGAVRAGEVVDTEVVAEAIRRLWRETGLRGHTARVGVASERVVVRTIELPAVPDDELAGALRFQAQDYVPIPLDEVVLDFHVLARLSGADGEPLARILLVAAHRETVGALLQAVSEAGITASGVDLLPLALIRALRPPSEEPGSAEAIVSVGAGVTTVVVHEGGLPRVVRFVAAADDAFSAGGDAFSGGGDAFSGGGDAFTDAAPPEAGLSEIIGAVHGSLDYYLNQPDAVFLKKVLLTGGGSLTAGLAEDLAASLGLPVELGRPREMMDVGDIGIPEERIPELDPYLPVAVGLALGGRGADGARIDLLPPESRRQATGRQTRRRLGAAAAVILVVLAGLGLFQLMGASRQRDRLASQQRTNQVLQGEIDELSGSLQVEKDLVLARQGVTAALAGDVSWPRVLEDLAGTLPEGVWLTNFSLQPAGAGTAGATATATGVAPATARGDTIGTASFAASGFEFPDVADWLDRLPRIPYYLNLFVSSATRSEAGPRPLVSFTSSASVGPAARSDRLQRILGPRP